MAGKRINDLPWDFIAHYCLHKTNDEDDYNETCDLLERFNITVERECKWLTRTTADEADCERRSDSNGYALVSPAPSLPHELWACGVLPYLSHEEQKPLRGTCTYFSHVISHMWCMAPIKVFSMPDATSLSPNSIFSRLTSLTIRVPVTNLRELASLCPAVGHVSIVLPSDSAAELAAVMTNPAAFPNLTSLHLDHAFPDCDEVITQAVLARTKLTSLRFPYVPPVLLKEVCAGALPALSDFAWSAVAVTDIAEDFSGLRLTALTLGNVDLSAECALSLASVTTLTTLHLAGCHGKLAVLAALPLTDLAVTQTVVEDEFIEALAGGVAAHTLRKLKLPAQDYSLKSLRVLSNATPALTNLTLAASCVADGSVARFMAGWSNLRSLDLGALSLGARALTDVVTACPSLEHVVLWQLVDDRALAVLASLPSLTSVDLRNCYLVTSRGLQALLKAPSIRAVNMKSDDYTRVPKITQDLKNRTAAVLLERGRGMRTPLSSLFIKHSAPSKQQFHFKPFGAPSPEQASGVSFAAKS